MKKINVQKASLRIGSVGDIRKTVLPKFVKVWKCPVGVRPFERHKYGRRKPTETSFPTYA